MSQALQQSGGVGGAGTMASNNTATPVGKPVVGQGASKSQPHPQTTAPFLSTPMAGMPGVLPASILQGHMTKPSVAGATPIVGSGANLNINKQQTAPVAVTTSPQPPPPGQSAAMATAAVDSLSNSINNLSLANTKEKTPMCLINELARFNKVQHQYTLTDEQGPAHKKIFFVKLRLGDEEYAANGPSIKKAQHAAAALALEGTQYKEPPPKPPRATIGATQICGNPSITPTVELNAMAMKLGQPAIYRPLEPARNAFYPPNFNFRGMYNQRYHQPRYPRIFYVSLKVGQREFIGEGSTRQAARHNAAEKALKVLSVLPITSDEVEKASNSDNGNGITVIATETSVVEEEDEEDPLKSEISLVHEIALKRNLHVSFEVIKESGPPHMKLFVTRCTCGNISQDGEGNSKKLSKKRAAEKMLEELNKLPNVSTPVLKPKKPPTKKKNSRNIIKKADPDYGIGINPISRLIQIQQAKKEKEPVYVLVAEKGMPRRKEFVMQVTVGDQSCTGAGPNKKLAKRNAAEAMLQLLGYSRPSPQPSKSAIKTGDTSSSPGGGDKKVTFLDTETNHSKCYHGNTDYNHSRQLVPGVLMIPESPRVLAQRNLQYNQQQGSTLSPGAPAYTPAMGDTMGVKYSPQTTAAIAKELLDTGASPTAEAINKAGGAAAKSAVNQSAVRPKQQLLYLAEVLGFQVQFTDFPKSGKKREYLSLVSLSTNPPSVSHGSGSTIDASHDLAALTALKALSDLGLDSVSGSGDATKAGTPPATAGGETGVSAAGDGPHIRNPSTENVKKEKI